ncbi:MAG: hypothetical protein HN353_10745 [Bdellovibrionales bacterium]|jgi:phosphate-selective porin OprO and OprP|nr:hypothetical protein [Bdellovibrionales bacterium]MBT3524772.1 hypothetical protein [Bdellovibrionales bacterium]MBT7670162.1 hypothetical protein [Bdellovibrionales bacterium]MBT7766089.1 hypothetical protein [Bdellovibrionales bacterium]
MSKLLVTIAILFLPLSTGFAQIAKRRYPQLTARLQFDLGMFTEDRTNLAQGGQLRKAYLGLKGKLEDLIQEDISSNWSYKINYDLANNSISAKDLWGRYRGDYGAVKFGTFKEPFGMENLMSSAGLLMMERSLPDALVTGRSLGVTYSSPHLWRMALDIGFFGEGVTDQREDEDEGHAITARLTSILLSKEYGNPVDLHFGLSASRRAYSKEDNSFKLDSTPEIEVNGTKLVNSGAIKNVRSSVRLGHELALLFGNFALLGEYITIKTNRNLGQDYHFDGGSLSIGYTICGIPRSYDRDDRKLSKVSAPQGVDRLEVTIRYSWVDLNDQDIAGGRESNLGAGVNWSPNRLIRFSTNVIWAKVERDLLEEQPMIYAARVQLDI